jgi:hypothetical protein
MKDYPIFTRTVAVVVPACVMVVIAGAFPGYVVAVVVASLIIGQTT